MKGMALAKEFYEVVLRPAISKEFMHDESKIAVGLVGQGSQCFGFDDILSTDHDFGAEICLWLDKDTFVAIGEPLAALYASLPRADHGFGGIGATEHAQGRTGVLEVGKFYKSIIGTVDIPQRPIEWFLIAEKNLSTATNGEVFSDPLGEFSRIRKGLLEFYPEDVRLKKMAAKAALMGQSGQYNYARCMNRGEYVAAALALAEFADSAMKIVFLLNKAYCPFYKWTHRALKKLPILNGVASLVEELFILAPALDAWDPANPHEYQFRLNHGDPRVVLIEEICRLVVVELHRQELSCSQDSFLLPHAYEMMSKIKDSVIKSIPLMEG